MADKSHLKSTSCHTFFLLTSLHATCPVFPLVLLHRARIFLKRAALRDFKKDFPTWVLRVWTEPAPFRDTDWKAAGSETHRLQQENGEQGPRQCRSRHLHWSPVSALPQNHTGCWNKLVGFYFVLFNFFSPRSFVRLFSSALPHLEFKLCKGWDIELKWKENVSHLFSSFHWTQKKYDIFFI